MPLRICSPIPEIFPLSPEMSHLDWISANHPYLPIFLHLNPSVFPYPSFDLLLFFLSCFPFRIKLLSLFLFPLSTISFAVGTLGHSPYFTSPPAPWQPSLCKKVTCTPMIPRALTFTANTPFAS